MSKPTSPTTDIDVVPGQGRVIAHVDTERGFSGGEVQVFLLMDGLARAGWTNLMLCQPNSRCAEEAAARGHRVETVAMRNDLHLTAVPRLARAMRSHGAALAHLHTGRANFLGGMAARRAGVPALTTRRMDREIKRSPWTRYLYGRLVQRAVSISPAVDALLEAGGVPADMRQVIPSSVDPEALRPSVEREATRASLQVGPDEILLLAVARLSRRKGIDVLLEALGGLPDELPSWRLGVAGDGGVLPELRQQCADLRLGGRVTFLGTRHDVPDLLAACDVFCMPSRREGLGIAALEAMAAGKPVVGSAVGGLADAVVHERTGLLTPPGRVDPLRASLQRVLADATLRTTLGEQGPVRIREGFHHEQMVASYARLYGELLGARSAP